MTAQEVQKKATRAAYGEALVELAEKYPELVVLEADLSGATMTKGFAKEYPDRFFDCGIAEANMTVIAAGMSTCGLKPFTNTFAVFAAGRSYEQVRNSIAYPGLNVVVVGSHGGISVGEDGATHQMLEDLTLMRVLPGMTVVNPCDANEMKLAVEALIKHKGPAYLRLGRSAVPDITGSIPGYSFELGKGVQLRDGNDITIAATGMTVQMAVEASDILKESGVSARVIDIHTIKPLDEEIILKAAGETKAVLTVEEHSVIGGLGGAVAELLSEKHPVPVFRHGIEDTFGRSGSAADVLEYYGITARAIAEKARGILEGLKQG
ncbi:MAG: transketolase family protein [Lachnospiraceae bacterium]|nr:transketolase family protein [Lachnospiraceae bacterium]